MDDWLPGPGGGRSTANRKGECQTCGGGLLISPPGLPGYPVHVQNDSNRCPIPGLHYADPAPLRCQCGAQQHSGCFCNLTPHEFLTAHPDRSL